MKYLFTSKNLTHRQKLYRWVVIGCWVVMGYACVAVIVFNDDWGQWRFYGGFAGSSHFGVWGVVLAWGRGLPDD